MPLIHNDTYTVGMLPNFLKSIYVYIEADTALHLQQVESHQQMLLSALGKLLIVRWLSHHEF